jgi:hypothetical protein
LNELQALFNFTDADLVANRAGRLSDSQRERLTRIIHDERTSVQANRLTFPVMIALGIAYFVLVPPWGERLGPLICIVIVLALGVFGLVSFVWQRLLLTILRRRPPASLEDAPVTARSGLLTVEDDGEHRHLLLDGVEVQTDVDAVEDERLWRLEPGQHYIFYSYGGHVIAVEHM